MNSTDYDIVIVGARCAGAPLATFLARQGASVLILDKAALPSDQVLSTHNIHPPGTDVLDELGVGDAMREVTPPMRTIRLNKGGAAVDLEFDHGRVEYCPRRKRLDGLLQKAAAEAGAELHDRTRVTGLLWDEDRVVGVRATFPDGEREIRAGLVVGADGRRSLVAEEVGAREYLGYDAPRGIYWSYWDAPAEWASVPYDMYLEHVGDSIRVVFHTDGDQLLISSAQAVDEIRNWRPDPLAALTRDLESNPVIAPLIAGAAPTEKVRGTFTERYFFRQAVGPGWMLVGDSGHHKDYVIGDGITEALLQARSAAEAISRGSAEALERWWRERDVEALPLFFFGQDEGAPGSVSELERVVLTKIRNQPALKKRMTRIFEHDISPYAVFPVRKILGWMLGALARGRWRVLPEFLAQGRRASTVNREWAARKKVLKSLHTSSAATG